MLFTYFRDNGERDREIWDELNGQFDANPIAKISSAKLTRWLSIANVMLDVGVNSLPPLFFFGGMDIEFNEFVSILSCCNTHLKELYVTFHVSTHCFSTPCYLNIINNCPIFAYRCQASMIILRTCTHQCLPFRKHLMMV